MTSLPSPLPVGAVRHASAEEYHAFLRRHYPNLETQYFHRSCYAQFLQAYPDLQMWFETPLSERVGRLYGTGPREWCNRVSYRARPYLYFLVSRGYATLDWDWLIAVSTIHLEPLLQETGLAQGIQPRIEAVAERYIAARRLTDRPGTILSLEFALRHFIGWLAETHPSIESWASVTRDHLLEYAGFLDQGATTRKGKPLATNTKRKRLSNLSRFFSDTAAWGWEETPGHSLLSVGDLPKLPERIPRYIPEEELARLMQAVGQLSCPYQRAALLIARWSGARRGEIRRLALHCLDRYPDGTARLHIPVGKTKKERLIPLHEEAASAIRELQVLYRGQRGLCDEQTGVKTQYLFMRIGQLYSAVYLFENALQFACEK